jgi:hypothetical protein
VNHLAYESIEFYELNVLAFPPTPASMGCTLIADDDSYNDGVAFNPDGSKLVISLCSQTYYGILAISTSNGGFCSDSCYLEVMEDFCSRVLEET